MIWWYKYAAQPTKSLLLVYCLTIQFDGEFLGSKRSLEEL